VWPSPPSAGAFAPLVILVVAIVPAVNTWFYGALTPNQAAWGLRGFDLLVGDAASSDVSQAARVPPLFAWCTAAALGLPLSSKLWLSTLPSYFFGLTSIALVYCLGRLCCSTGVGILASFLFGVNQLLLHEIEAGEQTTCVLTFAQLGLYLFVRQFQTEDRVLSRWTWLGAGSFACLALSVGFNALWIPAVAAAFCLYHHLYRDVDLGAAIRALVVSPTMIGGVAVVGGGVALAAPWLLTAGWNWGPYSPFADPAVTDVAPSASWGALATAMPATVVLGLFGVWRGVQDCVGNRDLNKEFPLLLLWALFAWLALRTTSETPWALLFAIAPLTILAVRTLLAILDRSMHDRQVLVLILLSVWVFVVSRSAVLRQLPAWLTAPNPLTAQQKLDLHLAVDTLILAAVPVLGLHRLTTHHDRYRRMLLGGFVLAVIVLASLPWLTQFRGPKRRDDPWAQVHHDLLRHAPYDHVVMIAPEIRLADYVPLRFAVRALRPDISIDRVSNRSVLARLLAQSGSREPLVLVTDDAERLRTSTIHEGEYLVALTEIHKSDRVRVYARERIQSPRTPPP
jgi:hypothetical protein